MAYDYGGPSGPEAVDELVDPQGLPFAAYAYDEAGNVATRTTSDGSWSFAYDGENRQREVTTPTNNVETYYYDHTGTRMLAVERGKKDVTKIRLWFGPTEIHYSGAGKVTTTRAHVALAGPVARIENGTELVRTYHDELGNLLAAVDESGTLKAGYTYGPFGEILQTAGSDTDDYLRRFNGKESDQLSGLSYYGFRYYDPLSLMWTQADPLYRFAPDIAYDQPRRMTLYAFSLNNPLRHVDLNGLKPLSDEDLLGDESEEFQKETATVARHNRSDENTGSDEPTGESESETADTGRKPEFLCGFGDFKCRCIKNCESIGGPCTGSAKTCRREKIVRYGIFGTLAALSAYTIGSFTYTAAAGGGTAGLVVGPYGAITRAVVEKAAQGGSTIPVATKLTEKPQLGRALSVAVGENAQALATAARSEGTLYTANIPAQLIETLKGIGLASESITEMGGVVAKEIRFLAGAAEFIVPFF